MPLDDQVDGFCRRVVDAGFPARRFNMSIGTLHPRHGARSYIWRPSGLETEEFPRTVAIVRAARFNAAPK